MLRSFAASSIAALLVATAPTPASAQDYPNKPIRLIVPFAPGGPTDVSGRITAEYLSQRLGQPVVVENRPGAGTVIGMDLVAKARPDGYTLVWAGSDAMSILPALKPNLPFKISEDFTFTGAVAKSFGMITAISAKLPFRSISELVAYAKANPGKLRYASAGVGSGPHMTGALIAKVAGIDLVHVPFQGTAPAVTAAVGGFVDIVIAGAASIKPFADAGTLRPLAAADKTRHPVMPDVPTLEEAGIPDVSMVLYFGILAPAGTPESVLARLEREMAEMPKDPTVGERIRGVAFEPTYLNGKDFRNFVLKDLQQWQDLAKSANIVLPE